MAAPTGGISALLGPLAPSSADTAAAIAATSSSAKSMEQLMNEIDQLKKDVDTATKTLEKIETGRKKAAANRDRSVEGRTQIRDLNERIINLQKQMDAMTKDTDPKWPAKKFDKTKKTALKTLSGLSKDLNDVDKHLEKATGTIPATTATSADLQTTATSADGQPVAAPRASTENENTKGVSAFIKKLPFGKRKSSSKKPLDTATPAAPPTTESVNKTDDAAQKKTKDEVQSDNEDEEGEEEDEEEEGEEEESDEDVVSDKKKVTEKSPRLMKKTEPIITNRKKIEISDAESDESEDDDDDDVNDNRQLLSQLKSQTLTDESGKDLTGHDRRSRSPTTPRSSKKTPEVKTDLTSTSSPRIKKTTTIVPPLTASRKKSQSPKGRTEIPIARKKRDHENEDDSYFEEEEEEDERNNEEEEEEELRHLREADDRGEYASDHDYDEQEEEPTLVNAHVQELRTNKFLPGTQFIVTHDLIGEQTGDLTVHKNDIITLVEQRSDDWWLFKNVQTQQEGSVPINIIQLLSTQQIRRRIMPSTSAITLVNAFKDKSDIPTGFIPSDLAELCQHEPYQLWRSLIPKMNESNLAFTDLSWRADTDKLHVQDVIHQKILTLKECVKIPRVKGEQIRVLDRCVRICLYDGAEIISNIHTIRALIPSKIDERDLTEDWHFVRNDTNSLIDEQPELLIRSNASVSGKNLKLLMELSLWCQSTVTQEKCEIGCGWSMISIVDDEPPLITDTKNYNELLKGGHIDETNILLDSQYKILRSNGISGMIDRFKRARIKFSIESREDDVDLLYDNLPIQSLIVPINIIRPIVFFRNELACQLHERQHPTGLSTTPINSIFLSTFFQAISQPDLIYTLNRLYRARKSRYPTSSSSLQQQRKLFINTYQLFTYPLLQYRLLPLYDFHDKTKLNERRTLINDIIKRLLPRKKDLGEDILSILLDASLTDKWTPFTTNEICFSLQKYTHDFTNDIVD
ncbi:unnamed protein product [Rotaria sp. Silwood2]|nr:unnamed protein product [Rotaria sp. Silwood2]CAF3276068.1 unnamed protein product [Rotaria sp. Silwood2]CAF4193298.1 unnamed protein product [Rotaria sp. Silwood2]CAF4512654.1 unnamed protein product [Rotaria sp. Silwood2]